MIEKPEVVTASSDPMVRAMKRAYRSTKQFEWDALVAEETRWKRKVTIAQNKLADVRNRMNKFTEDAIKPSLGPAILKPEDKS